MPNVARQLPATALASGVAIWSANPAGPKTGDQRHYCQVDVDDLVRLVVKRKLISAAFRAASIARPAFAIVLFEILIVVILATSTHVLRCHGSCSLKKRLISTVFM